MKCPNCQVPLVMTERSGVEIDYCPQCRGVWLDRGELDKIIDRSAQSASDNTPAPPAPSQPTMPPHHYPSHDPYKHGYKKKKKNFLDDIFDF
ncbi:MAG: zf-TFIIB domain-containing protein [Bacteroidota bacterium]